MTQVLHFRSSKGTFRFLEKKLVLREETENLIHMGNMVCPGFTIDENIIKENEDKMMEKRMENMVHETLESGGRITQAKGHDQEFIVTLTSTKNSPRNFFFFHTYMVVARMKIKFSKVLRTT
jgi:hypothetical protein